jgi:ribokinase
MDYLARGPRLPAPGDTVQGNEFQEAPGGKGANQAVAASRLGARVALIARVGADARGDAIVERLQSERVDVQFLLRDAGVPTGVAVIQVDERGEKQILTSPGANLRLSADDVLGAAAAIRAARVVLAQLETPLGAVGAAARLGREAGAQFVLDPAPPTPLPDDLLRLVDVIRPNAGEARVLTGVPVRDRPSARMAARALLERGARAVAVQAGDAGNLLVWREGERLLPKIPVKSVDATGAGDAFAAALAVMVAEGRTLEEAGPFASAAAALTTTKLGAQASLPRRDEVLALVARGEQQAWTEDPNRAAEE